MPTHGQGRLTSNMKATTNRCHLVLFTLLLNIVSTSSSDDICTNVTLPSDCTCFDDENTRTKVTCVDAGLTSLPTELPPVAEVVIENNTIDVIDHVPYGSAVQYLYLDRDKIRLIQDGAFQNLSNLETLSLESNEITGLRRETFLGLDKLKTLKLVGNPVYVLEAGTFVGSVLPQLENLDMDSCRLFQIADGAIDGLANLMFLTLSNNQLRRAPVLACTEGSLANLVTLDLSHNRIVEIPANPSCGLPSLRNVNFNYNRIAALNASFCDKSMLGVRALYLQHNALASIALHAFEGCPNLTILDVSHNKLVKLDNNTLSWHRFSAVILGDNPWHCDCDSIWLIKEKSIKEHNSADAFRCSTPTVLQNVSVFSVYDDALEYCILSPKRQILPIVIGIVCSITAICITCVVIYFAARKRRIRYPLVGMAAPGSGSSAYRRMSTGNEVIFDYTSTVVQGGPAQNKPIWKEMSTYGPENTPTTS